MRDQNEKYKIILLVWETTDGPHTKGIGLNSYLKTSCIFYKRNPVIA